MIDDTSQSPTEDVPDFPIPTTADREKPRRIVERILAGGYTSMAAVCGCLFFLPWVQLSCSNDKETKIGYSQTGYQVAAGELTRSEDLDKFYQSVITRRRAARGKIVGGNSQSNSEDEIRNYEQKCSGFPGLWAFPAGVALIVLAGLVHLFVLPGARPTIPTMGVGACALALGACLFVDLPIEQQIESRVPKRARAHPEYRRLEREITLERLPAFNASLGLTGGIFLLVMVHYSIAAWRQRE